MSQSDWFRVDGDKIYDTHTHLDHLDDMDQALSEALSVGVTDVVVMSIDLASSQKTLSLTPKVLQPRLHLALGMHPSETNEEHLSDLMDLIRKHRSSLCAVGEIGLDYWYPWIRKDIEKKQAQQRVFKELLILAKKLDLPAVIHSRGAWKDCYDMVKEVGLRRAEFHWYSGPLDVLEWILKDGFFVSTTPSLAYSEPSRLAMVEVSIEQLLIETDCPVAYKQHSTHLRPELVQNDLEWAKTKDRYPSQPADVFKTLNALCALRGWNRDEALLRLNQNAQKFFNISD